jgi:hypothetical protein
MIQRGTFAVAILSACLGASGSDARQRPTTLEITNNDDAPIKVWIRPSKSDGWPPVAKIAPHDMGRFRLRGFPAVDILVCRNDDTFVYLPNAKLGAIQRGPNSEIQIEHELAAREGHIERTSGRAKLVYDDICGRCAPDERNGKLTQCCPVALITTNDSKLMLSPFDLRCKAVEQEHAERHDSHYQGSIDRDTRESRETTTKEPDDPNPPPPPTSQK